MGSDSMFPCDDFDFACPPPWGLEARLPADERRRLQSEIREMARAKKAVILAHNYQLPEIQCIADSIGDSLALARTAQSADAEIVVFCGVHFMAESAKILNPGKKVLLPNLAAGCSLADSITPESLLEWKSRYPEHAVVTYINSSAAVKALSDICCTSANAVSVVRKIEARKVLFTPDKNLGRWVAGKVPEKEVVVYDGACPVHDILRGVTVEGGKRGHPDAIVIAHPECREDVIAIADEVCSTSGMADAVARHPESRTFIVATEWSLVYQLKKRFPDREFIVADGCIGCRLHCPYMKMIDLRQVHRSLDEEVFEVTVDLEVARDARRALERMVAIPRDP
jgi:quinolinate synthase